MAQESGSNKTTPVTDIRSFISSINNSNLSVSQKNAQRQQIENLLYHTQPSVYFYDGVAKTYGNKPNCFFTDLNSLNKIQAADILRNNIELVTIAIDSEWNAKIDLSVFSSFKNLKYINIVSGVAVSKEEIASMILGYNEKYSIFYKIDNADTAE